MNLGLKNYFMLIFSFYEAHLINKGNFSNTFYVFYFLMWNWQEC